MDDIVAGLVGAALAPHVSGEGLRRRALTRGARRAAERFLSGREAWIPAYFLPAGATRLREGRLRLKQGAAAAMWTPTPAKVRRGLPVCFVPGEPVPRRMPLQLPANFVEDAVSWRVLVDEGRSGALILRHDLARVFGSALTRPRA